MWRRQRRLSNPAFRRAAIDGYANAMVSSTQSMLKRKWGAGAGRDDRTEDLRDSKPLKYSRPKLLKCAGGSRDVYADFNQLTLEITLEALFGFVVEDEASHVGSQGSGQAAEIVQAVETAFEFFTKRAGSGLILPEWVPTLDNIEFGMAVQQLDKVWCTEILICELIVMHVGYLLIVLYIIHLLIVLYIVIHLNLPGDI